MNINDHIYFAPGILLKEINLNDKYFLIQAFKNRINGFFLSPIKSLNKMRSAYAACIIEFSMIDALARYSTTNNQTGPRIKEMLKSNLGANDEIAEKAYNDFRNGLLHENHIKNNGQLCYETTKSFLLDGECLILNPLKLQRALDKYLKIYITSLSTNDNLYQIFYSKIKSDFESEIQYFNSIDIE